MRAEGVEWSIFLASEAQTEILAQQCAHAVQALLPRVGGLSLSLHGFLGAGKTTWARYFFRALGIAGRIKSPSYAIVESYESAHFPVWHFDFYRLHSAEEWEDAGFREIFASAGLRVVEWPSQLPAGLVHYDLQMEWALDPQGQENARQVKLIAGSAAGLQLLQNLEHARQTPP